MVEAGSVRFALEKTDPEKMKKFVKSRNLWQMYIDQCDHSLSHDKATLKWVKGIANMKDSGFVLYQTTDKEKLTIEQVK